MAVATIDTIAPQIDATAAKSLPKGLIRRIETTLPRVTCRSTRMCREVGGMRGNERPAWERRGGRGSECDDRARKPSLRVFCARSDEALKVHGAARIRCDRGRGSSGRNEVAGAGDDGERG